MDMKRWKFVHVRRSGPFANYPKSIFSWDNVACILEKEMRQIYPWLKQVGRRVYEPILFPPTTSAFGVWTKAIAEECARNGGWATLHSEKIRLNRYNRRRVRQALRCNPFAEVPQNIKINKRDIM